MITANWIAFVAALLIGLLVAWWVFARGSKDAGRRERRPDVLDEGAERAGRNQALIDAPPAASMQAHPAAGAMAGIGEVVAVASQDEVEEDTARRDMEETVRAREDAGMEDDAAPEVVPPADTPAPVAETAAAQGDDLRQIKGIGPKLVTLLHSLGVTRFEQIAGWTEEDLARIDAQLGAFQGRPERDSWVEQARLLASGDTADYEARFGKL